MFNPTNEGITSSAMIAIRLAAKELDAPEVDVQSYYVNGDKWGADTPEELADRIVECWREQARSNEEESASRHQ